MPTYQYRGTECGHEFEVRQSFADDPLTECIICGQPVKRVIQPAPIVFKGSGWYITDSRPTKESSGGVQDPAKVAEKSKIDSKPADSSEAKSDKPATPSPAATTTKSE